MKKALFTALLLLALVLAGILAAGAAFLHSREQVEVTTRALEGDLSAAEGFVLSQTLNYRERLYWDQSIPLAHPEETETTFTFRLFPPEPVWVFAGSPRITLPTFRGGYDDRVYFDGPLPFEAAMELEGVAPMAPVFTHLRTRTQPGQTVTETLDLSQYLDILPLKAESMTFYLEHPDVLTPAELSAYYTDFFSIPVPEGMLWTFTLSLYEDGSVEWLIYGPQGWDPAGPTDPQILRTLPEHSDSDLWFTLCPPPGLDFSHTPGGLGIYHLDRLGEDPRSPADPHSITNLYSLPPDARPMDLTLSPEEDILYLTYETGGALRCDMVDAHRGILLHRFPVPLDLPPEAGEGLTLCLGDGCLLYLFPEELHLFAATPEGGYAYRFSAPLPEQVDFSAQRHALRAAWGGDTLALLTPVHPEEALTGGTVAFYREGRLVTLAVYDTSLSDRGQEALPETAYAPVAHFPGDLSLHWAG